MIITFSPGGSEVARHAVVERKDGSSGTNLSTHVTYGGHPYMHIRQTLIK